MPILAKLLAAIATGTLGFFTTLFGAIWGIRIAAAVAIGTIYVSCVVAYSAMIAPWLGVVFTTGYGWLLGLLFPPVAGSVLAALSGWWAIIVGKRYITMLTKLAVG